MRNLSVVLLIEAAMVVFGAPSVGARTTVPPAPATQSPADYRHEIEAALERHTRVLASDAYEGRLPGTKGDSLAVAYIVTEYERIGLTPGAQGGLFRQAVPLLTRTVAATATVLAGGRTIELRAPANMILRDVRPGEISMNAARAVFVGYGIVAPQLGRDEYHGHNVAGQVVFMLDGHPPTNPSDTTKGHLPPMWGPEATSEGKVAAARARGAAAVIFLHDSALAGYPYSWIEEQWRDGAIRSDTVPTDTTGQSMLSLYLPRARAAEILTAAGQDLGRLGPKAASGGMVPVPLNLSLAVRSDTRVRRFTSSNVIGKIEGTNRSQGGDAVVYTAHWDHLGRDTTLKGDQIYNGAVDNAGGVAQLLEIARALMRSAPRPPRTIVFIATTAEEPGLLGASYYVAHPTYPLVHTLAEINLDFFLPWGRTRDVINYGPTGSTLDDVVAKVARSEGRSVTPDPTPEENFFQRADQYPFALAGVPSIFPAPGSRYVGRPEGYGAAKIKEYAEHDYHQVSDSIRSDWDWSGAAQEVAFLTRVGYLVATGSRYPTWKVSTSCPSCRARRATASTLVR